MEKHTSSRLLLGRFLENHHFHIIFFSFTLSIPALNKVFQTCIYRITLHNRHESLVKTLKNIKFRESDFSSDLVSRVETGGVRGQMVFFESFEKKEFVVLRATIASKCSFFQKTKIDLPDRAPCFKKWGIAIFLPYCFAILKEIIET